jgi:uncharacterized protein with GYD domain
MKFMVLVKFTEQGVKAIGDTLERAGRFRMSVQAAGGNIISQFWCLGTYDGCVIFDVPSEEDAMAVILGLEREGNVRTETHFAFSEPELKLFLEKVNS